MKKQYIIPETLVMNIRFKQTLLDASPKAIITDSGATTDGNSDYEDSRGFLGFGDDDE